MKINFLIKYIPLLSTLILIIFLCFSNQRENTKIKILIWESPSLSIGTYIAISSGTGFILSYFITNFLSSAKNFKEKRRVKYIYKDENEDLIESEYQNNKSYDNTLFERDINDPSPTINASFRVIGKTNRKDDSYINNEQKQNYEINELYRTETNFEDDNQETTVIKENEVNSRLSDWEDESYKSW